MTDALTVTFPQVLLLNVTSYEKPALLRSEESVNTAYPPRGIVAEPGLTETSFALLDVAVTGMLVVAFWK